MLTGRGHHWLGSSRRGLGIGARGVARSVLPGSSCRVASDSPGSLLPGWGGSPWIVRVTGSHLCRGDGERVRKRLLSPCVGTLAMTTAAVLLRVMSTNEPGACQALHQNHPLLCNAGTVTSLGRWWGKLCCSPDLRMSPLSKPPKEGLQKRRFPGPS